jgi:hypothetical protein
VKRALVCGVIALCAASRADAQTAVRKDFESLTVTAQTVEVAPQFSRPGCDPVPGWCVDTIDLHLRLAGKTRPPIEVTIPDFGPSLRPDMIELRGTDRVLINGANDLSVFDVRTGEFVDRIAGFRMVESPDNRYAAYVRLSSKRERWSDDAYLIYDVDQPPAANRMLDSLPDMPSRSAPATNAGIAIYPPENATAGLYFAARTEKEAHHSLSTLLWISGHELVFADRWQDKAELVLIDLADGVSKPQVYKVALDSTLDRRVPPSGKFEVPEMSFVSRDYRGVTVSLDRVTSEPQASLPAGLKVRIPVN